MADESTSTGTVTGSETSAPTHDDFDLPFDAPDATPPATGAAAETPAPPPDATPTAPPAPGTGTEYGALPAPLAETLRSEGLKPVADETPEAAYARLSRHLTRKNQAYARDLAKLRDRQTQELAGLRQTIREQFGPIVQEHYERRRQEELELAAAQIPPKDTPEYQVWLQEELLRRDDARRQEEWERAQQAQRQEADAAVQDQIRAVDEVGYQRVAEGLGLLPGTQADPDFTHAYEVYSESAVSAARGYFPDASDEQIQEFIGLSQQLDIRRAELNGVDIREVWKGRLNAMIDSLVRRGLVTRAQGQAAKAEAAPAAAPAPGSNGQGARPAPVPAATAPPPATVAQRVTQDAAAAARRGPAAVPGSSRPTQLPGQLPNADELSSEDYVDAVLAGIFGSEEQRVARHQKQR